MTSWELLFAPGCPTLHCTVRLSDIGWPMSKEPAGNSDKTDSHRRKEASCIPYFDALWFCYCEYLVTSAGADVLHMCFRALYVSSSSYIGGLYTLALTAAPVHQFKQYYRVGNVDDCLSYWNNLYDCLRQKTKYKDVVCVMRASLSFSTCVAILPKLHNM